MSGPTPILTVELTVGDLTLDDLTGLGWSGSAHHLGNLAEQIVRAETGECRMLGLALPTGLLIAIGGVDFRVRPGPSIAGAATQTDAMVWLLSVHDAWRSLGLGTMLIGRLELAALDHGLDRVVIEVEHDNPRAATLYRRLGYRVVGSRLDSWRTRPDQHYLTVVTVMAKTLSRPTATSRCAGGAPG